jgi:hypothetical protein
VDPQENKLKSFVAPTVLLALILTQHDRALSAPTDPWSALGFLEGTWAAHTQGGSAGTYTFEQKLKHHVLARHSTAAACKGPEVYDCEHSDILYVYQNAAGQPLRAIYFDNEGHVIHYAVSTPNSTTAIFISEPSSSGPQFRLVYELIGALMSGKFQMRMPGQVEWKSYLEWSGAKK